MAVFNVVLSTIYNHVLFCSRLLASAAEAGPEGYKLGLESDQMPIISPVSANYITPSKPLWQFYAYK